MRMIIDRIEGKFAVCEMETKELMDIPLDTLPIGCKEGMKLEEIDGIYTILDDSVDRKRIHEKMNRLFQS